MLNLPINAEGFFGFYLHFYSLRGKKDYKTRRGAGREGEICGNFFLFSCATRARRGACMVGWKLGKYPTV